MFSQNGNTDLRLKIIIVGAGTTGLATAWRLAKSGHEVTVLERKPKLNIGGGDLQMSPNAVKAVRALGLEKYLVSAGDVHKDFVWRSWRAMEPLSRVPIDPANENPSMMFRRDDLVQALYEAAVDVGAKVMFDKNVTAVNEDKPSITTIDGEDITADLVVGADGVKSSMRTLLFPDRDTRPIQTGQVCFHINIPYELMKQDPETLKLYEEGQVNDVTLGPDRYITAWALHTRKEYFIITSELHYDEPAGITSWQSDAKNVKEMLRPYLEHGWPRPWQKVMGLAKEAAKWRIVDGVAGAEWVSKSSKVILIGDAIHAMPPHAAQGMSQGIEDMAALGEFLDTAQTKEAIPTLLRAFAEFREPRTTKIQQCSRTNLVMATLPDGPMQEQRDTAIQSRVVDEAAVEAWNHMPMDPNAGYADPSFLKWVQSYDVVGMARKRLLELSR